MKVAAIVLLAVLLGGCATRPEVPFDAGLLRDEWFSPPAFPVEPQDAMAVSPQMHRYVSTQLGNVMRYGDPKQRLVDALYRRDQLRLEYDSDVTRTAAQAFEARSGNCLALVLMTAAFAKELGIPVRYQLVVGDEVWDRTADLYVAVGHINLTLADRSAWLAQGASSEDPLTVDFEPSHPDRARRTRSIPERTVVAMFLNNRAVETLTRGDVDQAYAYARAAVLKDPQLAAGYLTLAVLYRSRHQFELADRALLHVLAIDPSSTKAMANRVLILRDLARDQEAAALEQHLAWLDPHPPFSYFQQGRDAFDQRRWRDARDLFAKEVERSPLHAEFRFWLALADLACSDRPGAQFELQRALALSSSRAERQLYAAKLDRLLAATPR